MHLETIEITNIRSIESFTWAIGPDRPAAGWHVILGDNGSGKSTILRAIALALIGPLEARALRQNWDNWLRDGASNGAVTLTVKGIPGWESLFLTDHWELSITLEALSGEPVKISSNHPEKGRYFWEIADRGGFSASFGPFRRFQGGDKEYEKVFYSNPKPARHLTIFGENIALTEVLDWLKSLRFAELEGDSYSKKLLGHLSDFINQDGFLPHGVKLDKITSKDVYFIDGNGCRVPVDELSDGFRSILSLTFELIRQLVDSFPPEKSGLNLFEVDGPCRYITAPGVVLIDEVDAHLHPTWQREIGFWFRQHFPNIQFIVTTHSPLVCHASDVGSVWHLPRPGSDEEGRFLTGTELDRLLFGDITEAYSTGAFGDGITRSERGRKLLDELAGLNVKELDEPLTEEEEARQQQLRVIFPVGDR